MKYNLRILFMIVVLVLSVSAVAQDEGPLVDIGSSDMGDSYLVDAEGWTLYLFDRDQPGVSNCYDSCAENWPPLEVESEDELSAAEGIPGDFGVIERDDGELQVTYNAMPLYYFARDEAPGDVNGDGVGNVWWIVEPVDVYVGGNDDLGSFLVGPTGMTLYLFGVDPVGEGSSECADDCLEAWPAFSVESEDALRVSRDIPGEFSFFEREDTGELQVAYNGWPLYYFAQDEAVGDANGQGRGDVWFVIAPEVVVTAEDEELGTILVGPRGYTLYTFANDEEGVSNCTEDCLQNWPPLVVGENDELVASEDVMGELGSIAREDTGARQVTYNGMPLYYFARDGAPGDTNGHNAGDVWFAVNADGGM